MSSPPQRPSDPGQRATRIHAVAPLVDDNLLARFEEKLAAVARERPELCDHLARMMGGKKP
jgi:hypothetical protein